MLTYPEKIVWKYKVKGGENPRFFLGQEKTRLLRKGFEELNTMGWRYGIEKLSSVVLEKFYTELYIPFIQKKQNSNVHNLIDYYSERIKENAENDQIFFAFIRNMSGALVAGGIFISKRKDPSQKTASLGFRAYDESVCIKKQKLGTFLEFLFYEWATHYGHHLLTRGQDRNGAGELGSALGIPLHKIEEHFFPYIPQSCDQKTIDPRIISQPTLFFLEPDSEGQSKLAYLYHGEKRSDLKRIQELFMKRGIKLILQ